MEIEKVDKKKFYCEGCEYEFEGVETKEGVSPICPLCGLSVLVKEVKEEKKHPVKTLPKRSRKFLICEDCGIMWRDFNITECPKCGKKTTKVKSNVV